MTPIIKVSVSPLIKRPNSLCHYSNPFAVHMAAALALSEVYYFVARKYISGRWSWGEFSSDDPEEFRETWVKGEIKETHKRSKVFKRGADKK